MLLLPRHRTFAFVAGTIAAATVLLAQVGPDAKPSANSPVSQPAAKTDVDSSSRNIQRLVTAILEYTKESQGRVPASLKDLASFLGNGGEKLDSMVQNPGRPELGENGYVYVPAQERNIGRITRPNDRVAIYEAGDFRDGVYVGFWDGHVEWIGKRSQFEALIAAAVPRSVNPRQFDPRRPETFGRVNQKASVEGQSFQIVRELTEAVVMYANDNRLRTPNDLSHLGTYLLQPNEVTPTSYLTNPRRPQKRDKGYEYIAPKNGRIRVDAKLPPDKRGLDQLPVVYEAGPIEDGIFVGFLDGHAEYIRDKTVVEKLLAAAKAR